jgi:tRNA dimethylallyltransferase
MNPLITILGPTASGKTEIACQLAYQINGEIISADSRQIYKHMDIGTGKDLSEYTINEKKIPYHLIDIHEPGYKYNIWEFQSDFLTAYRNIVAKKHIPILCGGSGLYIETALSGNDFLGIPENSELREKLKALHIDELKSLWHEMDEKFKNKLDDSTEQKIIRSLEIAHYISNHPEWKPTEYPDIKSIIFGIDIDREKRREKITKRLSYRLNHGLIQEVEKLLNMGLTHENLSYYGLEYKWISDYLQNKISKKELFEGLNIAIHQFAKRQMTWFRRMEKNGYEIHWINVENSLDEKLNIILKTIENEKTQI